MCYSSSFPLAADVHWCTVQSEHAQCTNKTPTSTYRAALTKIGFRQLFRFLQRKFKCYKEALKTCKQLIYLGSLCSKVKCIFRYTLQGGVASGVLTLVSSESRGIDCWTGCDACIAQEAVERWSLASSVQMLTFRGQQVERRAIPPPSPSSPSRGEWVVRHFYLFAKFTCSTRELTSDGGNSRPHEYNAMHALNRMRQSPLVRAPD